MPSYPAHGHQLVKRTPSVLSHKNKQEALRNTLLAAKVYGTTGQLTADDLNRLDKAVPDTVPVPTKSTVPKVRNRPTMAEIRNLALSSFFRRMVRQ